MLDIYYINCVRNLVCIWKYTNDATWTRIRTQDLTQEEKITLPLDRSLPHALKGFQILHTIRNYSTHFSIAHESSVSQVPSYINTLQPSMSHTATTSNISLIRCLTQEKWVWPASKYSLFYLLVNFKWFFPLLLSTILALMLPEEILVLERQTVMILRTWNASYFINVEKKNEQA